MIKNYILKYEKYSSLTSVMMIILAIFLIGKPVETIEAFVIAFSSIMVVEGIISFVNYFTIDKTYRLTSFDLISGIITTLTGILLFIYRTSLINVFPVILGIWIIINNLFKMQISINLSTIKDSGWAYFLLLNILLIIFGIVLIINPFTSLVAITTMSGIILLVCECINLGESIYLITKVKKL